MKKLLIFPILFLLSCSTEPEDCAGVVSGAAYIDDCEQCVGGTTANVANYLKDCAGICGGATMQEYCDECETQIFDCAGACDGTAVKDECGICNGAGIQNSECDCEGTLPTTGFDCDGNCKTYVDCEGVCGGDNLSCTSGGSFTLYPDITTIMKTDVIGNELGQCGSGVPSGCYEQNLYSVNDFMNPIPEQTAVGGVYPNPFNGSTSLQISLASDQAVNIFIVNYANEIIEVINDSVLQQGSYTFTWNASNYESEGGYFRLIVDFGDYECFENLLYMQYSTQEEGGGFVCE